MNAKICTNKLSVLTSKKRSIKYSLNPNYIGGTYVEDQFYFQLLKCSNHQKRWINQRTIQIDVLPGQSKVLQCLDEHGPLSPKEIGKLCIVDKSTTTSLLNKMEKIKKKQQRPNIIRWKR